MHCLEINMIKYISLSSVIARQFDFQKLLLKNNAFLSCDTIALKRRYGIGQSGEGMMPQGEHHYCV